MPAALTRSAATRLLVVVAVAVLALLVAPIADSVPTARASAPVAAVAPAAVEPGHVDAVKAERRAKRAQGKKTRKAKKKNRAVERTTAAALTQPAAKRWSGSTLTYYDGLPAQWAWSLRTAVEEWNTSGVALTLVPVADPAAAQVKVGYGDIGSSSGLATVGSTSGAFVKLSQRYASAAGDQYDRVEVMGVLTHELGHVLGLEHVTQRCDLMGPVMDIAGCSIFDMAQPDAYRCDVVGDAAVAAAVKLYGGAPRARTAGSCAVDAPLGTPAVAPVVGAGPVVPAEPAPSEPVAPAPAETLPVP